MSPLSHPLLSFGVGSQVLCCLQVILWDHNNITALDFICKYLMQYLIVNRLINIVEAKSEIFIFFQYPCPTGGTIMMLDWNIYPPSYHRVILFRVAVELVQNPAVIGGRQRRECQAITSSHGEHASQRRVDEKCNPSCFQTVGRNHRI